MVVRRRARQARRHSELVERRLPHGEVPEHLDAALVAERSSDRDGALDERLLGLGVLVRDRMADHAVRAVLAEEEVGPLNVLAEVVTRAQERIHAA